MDIPKEMMVLSLNKFAILLCILSLQYSLMSQVKTDFIANAKGITLSLWSDKAKKKTLNLTVLTSSTFHKGKGLSFDSQGNIAYYSSLTTVFIFILPFNLKFFMKIKKNKKK